MSDLLTDLFERGGLLGSGLCLKCDVCCRYPQSDTPLAPFFSQTERAEAIKSGIAPSAFPAGDYGCGSSPFLHAMDAIFRCPAFRQSTNDCSIYAHRPLDCRLYPYMLMYSEDGKQVMLGADRYCPAVAQASVQLLDSVATSICDLMQHSLCQSVMAARDIVGPFKDHLIPLRECPRLTQALCRTDLGLARLTPTVFEQVAPYFQAQGGSLSHHAFASTYVWSDIFDLRWKISGRRLLIIAEGEGDCFLICPPMGTDDMVAPAAEALALMRHIAPSNPSPRIQEADDGMAEALAANGWRVRETTEEYIYNRAALAGLRGNHLEKKRQMCNRFEREHTWRFRRYEPEDFSAAAALYAAWLDDRRARHPETFFVAQAEASFRAFLRGLRDADRIGLITRVLEADGAVVGVTTGCLLGDGRTFHVLHEVSDLHIKGAAQVMFREFCREQTACEFINTGSSSGLDSLTRVKESYRPAARPRAHVLVPA